MKRIRIDFNDELGPKGFGEQLAGVIRGMFFNDPDGQKMAVEALVEQFQAASNLQQSASPDAPPVRGETAKEPCWKTPKLGLF